MIVERIGDLMYRVHIDSSTTWRRHADCIRDSGLKVTSGSQSSDTEAQKVTQIMPPSVEPPQNETVEEKSILVIESLKVQTSVYSTVTV